MYPEQFHLHSRCLLMFHAGPFSRYSNGLNYFSEAKFNGMYGTLLLKQSELIFVPDANEKTLHLNKEQILEYKVKRKKNGLQISVLYRMFLLSEYASEFVRRYHFSVKEGQKEDWQF